MKCTITRVAALASAVALLAACQLENITTRTPEAIGSAVPAAQTVPINNALLAARLRAALASDPTTRRLAIQVAVDQRRARLSGFVDSAAAKLRAGVLAAETDGIEAVDNRLILRHHAGTSEDPIGEARVHL